MSVKKPIISLRVYRGHKVYYDENGNVENENQIITYTHNTLSWRLFKKHVKKHGYADVKVEDVYYSKIDSGKEVIEKVTDKDFIESVKNEVKEAFNVSEESLMTPEQKKIKELEAKLNSLIDSGDEGKTNIQKLRSEYYELAGKRCSPRWDEQTLEQKKQELKA